MCKFDRKGVGEGCAESRGKSMKKDFRYLHEGGIPDSGKKSEGMPSVTANTGGNDPRVTFEGVQTLCSQVWEVSTSKNTKKLPQNALLGFPKKKGEL